MTGSIQQSNEKKVLNYQDRSSEMKTATHLLSMKVKLKIQLKSVIVKSARLRLTCDVNPKKDKNKIDKFHNRKLKSHQAYHFPSKTFSPPLSTKLSKYDEDIV